MEPERSVTRPRGTRSIPQILNKEDTKTEHMLAKDLQERLYQPQPALSDGRKAPGAVGAQDKRGQTHRLASGASFRLILGWYQDRYGIMNEQHGTKTWKTSRTEEHEREMEEQDVFQAAGSGDRN